MKSNKKSSINKDMFKNLKIWFLKKFSSVKVYAWPLFLVYNPHTFSVKGWHYYEARKLIQPGDIVLRSYKQYLDSYFIPGEYSHAGLYLGGDEEKIIHALTPEVQYTSLVHFMRCDKFVIVRPNVSNLDITEAMTRAESKIGVPYDYDFIFEKIDTKGRWFSCSELCYYAYQKHLKTLDWAIKSYNFLIFKKQMFAPTDILPTEKSSSTLIYKI